jgi:hypothetical protein
MTAAQQAQLNEAKTRADGLERNGHNAGSIKFTLRQEGFAEAVIQQATEGRSMTALQELLAKVEAGTFGVIDLCQAFNIHPTDAAALKDGSLDAAIALHEAVLPGWSWSTATDAHNKRWFVVGDNVDYETDEIYHKISARALIIADIDALIAQEKSK